jgi:hypothetical protein
MKLFLNLVAVQVYGGITNKIHFPFFLNMTTRTSSSTGTNPRSKKARKDFDLTCPIGAGMLEDEITFPCGHYVCVACWKKVLNQQCPICRTPIPLGWKPRANRSLRHAINNVDRKTKCGLIFKLKEARFHRETCVECLKKDLDEKTTELNTWVNHSRTLQHSLDDAKEINNLLSVELERYAEMLHAEAQRNNLRDSFQNMLAHVHNVANTHNVDEDEFSIPRARTHNVDEDEFSIPRARAFAQDNIETNFEEEEVEEGQVEEGQVEEGQVEEEREVGRVELISRERL